MQGINRFSVGMRATYGSGTLLSVNLSEHRLAIVKNYKIRDYDDSGGEL